VLTGCASLLDPEPWPVEAPDGGATTGTSDGGSGATGTGAGGGSAGGAVCGDDEVEGDEQCDDGNQTAGDGCDPGCLHECGTRTDEIENPANGTCYLLDPTDSAWEKARATCLAWGGDLATIDGAPEQTFLSLALTGKAAMVSAWIGLRGSTDNEFVWVTGDPIDFDAWDVGQPTNAASTRICGLVSPADWLWHDDACANETHGALCERPPAVD
jgi:cysteine-rich repeat protein